MSLIHIILNDIKYIFRYPILLLSILLAPILIIIVLFSTQSSMYESKYEDFRITISIEKNDTKVYEKIMSYYSLDKFKSIIKIAENNTSDKVVRIVIPNEVKDTLDLLKNSEELKIKIINETDSKSSGEVINLLTNEFIKKEINKENMINKDERIVKLLDDSNSIVTLSKINLLDKNKSISFVPIIFMQGFLLLPYILIGSKLKLNMQKEYSAIRKRLQLIPVHPLNANLYNLISNLVVHSIIWLLFILICKLINNNSFPHNIFYYVLLNAVVLITLDTITNFLETIFNIKISYVLFNIVYLIVILSIFITPEKFNTVTSGLLGYIYILKYLIDPYFLILKGESLLSIRWIIFPMLILSIILNLLIRFILKRRLKL